LQVVTSIGMLHIGVVFVVFGVFLLGAGLIPDDANAQAWSIFAKNSWWNELVLTGLFAMGLGIFLIVLNSVISKKEEDDLEAYVQSQLTRSRSGKCLLRY
jgi:succinate dehydrogenase hydrophobic anchor subunit